jgi:hypothetical protein
MIEGRYALGHPERVVDCRHCVNDPVSQANSSRALARGGEQDLRRRTVRILLQEMVLNRPCGPKTQLVRQLDLIEGLLDDPVLGVHIHRLGREELIHDGELHAQSPSIDLHVVVGQHCPTRFSGTPTERSLGRCLEVWQNSHRTVNVRKREEHDCGGSIT